MISAESYVYYAAFCVACAVLGLAYLRLQATQRVTITTKEFKGFQNNFLVGYVPLMLVELLYLAFFFYVMMYNGLSLEVTGKLFIVSQVSATATTFLTEITDIVSRKTKCLLSALLYVAGALSLTSTDVEYLLIGGILRGAGSSLLHSAFEVYLINEHAINGFPDEWLSQTFSAMGSCLGACAVLCGVVGATSVSMLGHNGPPMVQAALACYAFFHMYNSWPADTLAPRYTLASFLSATKNTLQSVHRHKSMKATLLIQTSFEATAILLTFYWAPWIFLTATDHHPPYGVVFATFTVAATAGSYAFQIFASNKPAEQTLRALLLTSTATCLLGAMMSHTTTVLLCCTVVQVCIGMYWPCIGVLRGRHIPNEFRSACLMISRVAAVIVSAVVLLVAIRSPQLVLTCCAMLCGVAVYYHSHLDSHMTPEQLLEDYPA